MRDDLELAVDLEADGERLEVASAPRPALSAGADVGRVRRRGSRTRARAWKPTLTPSTAR